MKLQRLRYFVTLAKTLSFSRTAEVHYVSQTTVSQQIKALEDELGRALFTRTKRKVELTPAGRAYLEDVRKALDLLDYADEKVRLFRADEMLVLRVAVANGLTPGYVAPILGSFEDANPDVALDCSYRQAVDLHPALVAGDIDVALMYDLAGPLAPGTAKVEFDRLAHYVVVSNRSPLAQHARLARSQLAGERFVNALESRGFIPYAPGDIAGTVDFDAEGVGVGRTDVMADSLDALLLAVSLGEGYTMLTEPMVQAISPSLNLAAIPLADEKVPVVAVYRHKDDNPAVGRFLDYLRTR